MFAHLFRHPSGGRRSRRPHVGRGATVAALALVLSAQGAWADGPVGDGDGVSPVAGNALAFGSVCLGTVTTKPVLVAIERQGGGAQVFANSAPVSVTVDSISPSSFVATGGGTIGLPPNWVASSNGTLSTGTASINVTLTASALGSLNGTLKVQASGAANTGGTLTRTDTVSLTATGATCDGTPPTLNLPAPITSEATGPAGAVVSYAATATDANPASPAVSCVPASGSTFAIATTAVNCSATDSAGNTANGSFTVTVRDTTGPAIAGTPGAQSAEASGPAGAVVSYSDPTATDLVDGVRPVACLPPSGSTFTLGTTTVTCSASDSRSNTTSTTFTVTVADTTAPVLIVPVDVEVEATGPSGAVATFTASATDSVDGSIAPVCSPSSGSTFALGTTTVTCTATDGAGNDVSDSFQVTVVDTTPPDVTAPSSFAIEASGPSGAVATFSASATDLVDGALTPTCSPASGTTFALGSTTVTCSATDDAGNTGSSSFVVTVVDTTPPDLFLPADQLLEATGPAGAPATFTATATDIVDGTVPVSCDATSGDTFPLGTTVVHCSATDVAGNAATGSFSIIVRDTTPPALSVPGSITAEATGPVGAVVAFSASALDVVDGPVTPVCTPPSGSTFALGATTVNCSATDNSGNSTSGSFSVTVVDTTPPIVSVPADFSAEATGPSGAAVTFSVSAIDLVDGSIIPSCDATSGDTFPLGATTVNCSATDNAGNTGTAAFDVTIVDTTPPAVTVPASIVTDPTSISGAVVTYSGASATDLVDGSVPVTCVPPSGSTFGFGTTTVTCSATDNAGNIGTGTFTITVNGFTFRGFYQPVDMVLVNTVKNGSTVPVKWELFGAGGVEFTTTSAVWTGWPKTQKISCESLATIGEDAIETTATGGTSLRYDASAGQYIYNWQTPKQAGTCWRLDVKFVDGSTKSASFKLK